MSYEDFIWDRRSIYRVIGRTQNMDSESKIDLQMCHLGKYNLENVIYNPYIYIYIYIPLFSAVYSAIY